MNRIYTLLTISALACASAFHASALKPKQYSDSTEVPQRAILVTGDGSKSGQLVALLYDTSNLHFSDPSAPRFLFFDRKGKVALGIGGYVKGTLQYDFDGSIDDGAAFATYDIPVPANPAQRSQFYGNVNNSRLFLQLVGKSERFGYYQMYIESDFVGATAKDYGFRLRQAYVSVGYVLAGLASSTFVDGAAGTPVIDGQGPAGEMLRRNVMLRYAPRFSDHLSAAISIEMPKENYTVDASVEKINPRMPDIPLYLQYEWGGGKSHVRASALLRNLYYRDLVAEKNRSSFGWATQLSGKISFTPALSLLFQGAYGKGYGAYLNDLDGKGYDLVRSSKAGRMEAPRTSNFEVGLRYDFTSKFFATAVYSQVNVYGQRHLGLDSFRRSQYLGATAFYNVLPELQVGLEYLWGRRTDYSDAHGHANRLMVSAQYSF